MKVTQLKEDAEKINEMSEHITVELAYITIENKLVEEKY